MTVSVQKSTYEGQKRTVGLMYGLLVQRNKDWLQSLSLPFLGEKKTDPT